MAKKLKRTKTANDKNKRNNTEKKESGREYEASIDKPIEEKDEDAFDGFSYKMMSDHDFKVAPGVINAANLKTPEESRNQHQAIANNGSSIKKPDGDEPR